MMAASQVGLAVPNFWFGIVLVLMMLYRRDGLIPLRARGREGCFCATRFTGSRVAEGLSRAVHGSLSCKFCSVMIMRSFECML